MTLKDIQKLPTMQTRAVACACEDPETNNYVVDCVLDLYGGNYGTVGEEDTEYNNRELAAGSGHILAHYPARYKLENDIFINAVFDKEYPGIDSNHIMIMYTNEW